jgi:exonuclease SbcC
MKIEEFRIIHYGPLPDRGKIGLSDFNLIYGINETGKTLTLEALIKLLLGKNIKDFKNIERVEEEVDGYIVIGIEGEKKKLGRNLYLDDIAPISPSECRNIFIIRNSDLSIEPEATFYTEVTNRLTGLQTKRINKLKEKILGISELTPGGDFSNRKEDGHLKTRIENAAKLLKDINLLRGEIKEEGVAELEKNWVNLSDEIKKKEILREKLEEARKRTAYQSTASALGTIEDCRENLKELSAYSEEDLNKWRNAEREIERTKIKSKELKEELKKIEKELTIKKEELKEKKNEFEFAKIKKENIDKIRPLLTGTKDKLTKIQTEVYPIPVKSQYFIIVSVILALSILGLIIKESTLFMVLTITFGLFFLVSAVLQIKNNWDKNLLKKNFSKLKLDLSETGIKGEKIEDLLSEVESFLFKYKQQEEDIKEKEVTLGTSNNKKSEIQEKIIPELEKEKEKNEEIIRKIKSYISADNLKDFDQKLNKKKELEKTIEKEERVLEEILGERNWEEKTEELKSYKDKAKDIEFNEKEYESISKEISRSKEKLGEIEGRVNILSEKLKDKETKANKIFPEENLRCDGSTDLDNIYKKTKEFISNKESAKEDATVALDILQEIANEEKTKIGEQFGKESPVSKYFYETTGGFYKSVEFNEETEKIEVTRSDGSKLPPWKLSGGTYDQLYFSIRLALAEKIFPKEKGFFILDDPFIKASHDRLKVLIKMLKDISERNWQIIYFSAKEEIRETLGKDKNVKLIELESLL